MLRQRYRKIVFLTSIALIFYCGVGYAVDDGFFGAKKISGKHFTVFCDPGIDVVGLSSQLDIGPADRLLVGKTAGTKLPPEEELVEMLDVLFTRVCDILDMPLYNFAGAIKICRDYAQLNQIYQRLFGNDLNQRKAFYVSDFNAIYASTQDFTRSILGHEIAHAIISRYFVVLPSVKIQEILAAYAEYQLRKNPGK